MNGIDCVVIDFLPVYPPRTAVDPLTGRFSCRVQNFNPFHRITLTAGVSGLVKKPTLYCIYLFLKVLFQIYDKRDKFDLDIVNFPFLDGDVPRRPSYGVYISQLIRFARVCRHVDDFNARNNVKLLNFTNRVVGIISLERRFPSSIAGTMNWFQNSMSD